MTDITVAAFILAGGKSTRMGTDKAFLPFKGRTLLSRALETAHAITDAVYIVGDTAKFTGLGQIISDTFLDSGPLGGIHAALAAHKVEFNLVLAVDLPLVSGDLLTYLLQQARESNAVVTVPRVNGLFQPLCAVYKRDFADPAEQALRAANYKIDPLFRSVETRIISDSELQQAGFSDHLFTNVNTAEEYRSLFTGNADTR
jgi:molybdopterin-guanine dinucleotide biosynthesis protein A